MTKKEKKASTAKISKRVLERLSALADVLLISIVKQPKNVKLGHERRRKLTFVFLHYYFILLTLRGIEDRKLAKQLIPIFGKLELTAIEHKPFYGILSQILQLKHGIMGEFPPPASPEGIEHQVENLLHTADLDGIIPGRETLRHDTQGDQAPGKKKRLSTRNGRSKKEFENVMFR